MGTIALSHHIAKPKLKMDTDELEELANAIVDGILGGAILKNCSADKRSMVLEDALYELLLDHYGMSSMETAAFDLHQELVIQPRIAQSETDAAVDNHEARQLGPLP